MLATEREVCARYLFAQLRIVIDTPSPPPHPYSITSPIYLIQHSDVNEENEKLMVMHDDRHSIAYTKYTDILSVRLIL